MEVIGGKGYLKDGLYVIQFNGESEAKIGTLIDLEDEIIGYLDEGGNLADIKISPFEPIQGLALATKKTVETSMLDDMHDTEKEIFEIVRVSDGKVLDTWDYEYQVLEEVAELFTNGEYKEDEISIIRKVDYSCLYDIDVKGEVIYNFPDREEPEIDWTQKSNRELQKEIARLVTLLNSPQSEKPYMPEILVEDFKA